MDERVGRDRRALQVAGAHPARTGSGDRTRPLRTSGPRGRCSRCRGGAGAGRSASRRIAPALDRASRPTASSRSRR